MRHQIILIGRRMQTTLLGVKEFHPDAVYLFYTTATKDVYVPFAEMMKKRGVKVSEYLIDPYDYVAIKNQCRRICIDFADDDNVQFNVTEGTKIAAFAMITVGEDFGYPCIYYTQEGESIDFFGRERHFVDTLISNEEFFELRGNVLASHELCKDIDPADIITSREVKRFIEQKPRSFQRIKKQFRSDFGSHIDHMPETFQVAHEHNMIVEIKDGALTILDKGKPVFSDSNPKSTWLFFTGRWWEIIVSDIVYKWDRARRADRDEGQVWRNVEFRGTGTKTKNELDILVNDDRRLILLECKSGYISQDNIYKIDSVRETYGGEQSKAVLVSYYPLDQDLALKCRDLHIYYFAPEKESDCPTFVQKLPQWLDNVAKEIE